jgi:hypothetical protein
MIQNYLAEPLVKNYTAPKYPLFIALQNALNSINNKKSLRDPRPDISSVCIIYYLVCRKDWSRRRKVCPNLVNGIYRVA